MLFISFVIFVLTVLAYSSFICVYSFTSDAPQGFHQSLYNSLRALQEEEWELFQCTLDNAKYCFIAIGAPNTIS